MNRGRAQTQPQKNRNNTTYVSLCENMNNSL